MQLPSSWSADIARMHDSMGVDDWLYVQQKHGNVKKLNDLMKLRMRMLTEEYAETMDAYLQGDPEEMIDGLIDLCVIAIGTLDIAGVDPQKAWEEVLEANLSKKVGVKPGRPNPLGLPDLVKPDGWVAPDHSENHGQLDIILKG